MCVLCAKQFPGSIPGADAGGFLSASQAAVLGLTESVPGAVIVADPPPMTADMSDAVRVIVAWYETPCVSRDRSFWTGGPLHGVVDDCNVDDRILNAMLRVHVEDSFRGYEDDDTPANRQRYREVLDALLRLTLCERLVVLDVVHDMVYASFRAPDGRRSAR